MQRTLEIDINAPADDVWHILAHHFCEIATWHDRVQRSWPMDATMVPVEVLVAPEAPVPGRMVVTALGQLAEVLIEYSESERSFTFLALGVPGIVTQATNRTSIVPLGPSRCRVTLEVEMRLWGVFRMLDPILKRRAGRAFGSVLEDLKRYAESDSHTAQPLHGHRIEEVAV